ncbi:MAG: hypothetical protein LBL05_06115 [Synergistaceae bacterium]|jgi:hypothetical protein|nr:hypothetical protein [Synergistaceae bacterium]
MYMEVVAMFSIIAVLGVLLHCMFVTRRRILRICGWTVSIFTIGVMLINIEASSRVRKEPTRIINDLRNLRSAAHMFFKEFETWPLPGQEASLDAFCGRPTVLAKPPRFAKVALIDKPPDADDTPELYIGVELIPQKNEATSIQEDLARRAKSVGLLQQPVSGDVYKSGLSVYMQVF